MAPSSKSPQARWRHCSVALAMVVAGLGAACGSSGASSTTTRAPLPAGTLPSDIAKMVCQPKAQREIDAALGAVSRVATPQWADHVYSCRYLFATGSFSMSVKELSSWSQTLSYFRGLGARQAGSHPVYDLGQGAFQTAEGAVVVRKDWKVLLVDISSLPPRFGNPSAPSDNVALTVADVILGCWHGD